MPIGVLLWVLSSYMSSHIAHFLFSFHVPLFFVLYGYVHRIRENETIRCWLYGGVKN